MKFTSPEDDEIARLRTANSELRRQLDAKKHELSNTKACLHARNTSLNAARAQLDEANADKATLHEGLQKVYAQLASVTKDRDRLKVALVKEILK